MAFTKFPVDNSREIRQEAEKKIEELRQASQKKQEELQKQIDWQKPYSEKSMVKFFLEGGGIGGIVGFFACMGVCVWDLMFFDAETPVMEVTTWIVCIVIGAILGVATAGSRLSRSRTQLAQLERLLTEEQARLQRDTKGIQEDCDFRCGSYEKAFMDAVAQEGAYLVNSSTAQEIGNAMWPYFYGAIASAKRDSHIPKVKTELYFSVYPYAVRCNGKSFDFETYRVSQLGLTQQAALAKTLESALQMKAMTECGVDASGTPAMVSVQDQYVWTETMERWEKERSAKPCVNVTLRYEADNGFYEELKAW